MPNDIDIVEGLFGREVGGAISVRRKNKSLQYWKKCTGIYNNNRCPIHKQDFGWVTTGPVMTPLTAIEFSEFQASKHMTPLPQYGQYEVGNVPGQEFNLSDQDRRFLAIITKNGIHEFPIDQMLAYNWHRIEPVRIRFPQLAEVVDFPCEHGCAGRLFKDTEDYRQHLKIWHEDVAAPQAIGNEFRKALDSLGDKMQGVGTLSPELLAQLTVAISQALKENGAT